MITYKVEGSGVIRELPQQIIGFNPLSEWDVERLSKRVAAHYRREDTGWTNGVISFSLFYEDYPLGNFEIELDWEPVFYSTKVI